MTLPLVPGGAGAAIGGARAADRRRGMREAVDLGADAAKVVAQHGDEVADVGRKVDNVADLGKLGDLCSVGRGDWGRADSLETGDGRFRQSRE